jgi:hypothetical protein
VLAISAFLNVGGRFGRHLSDPEVNLAHYGVGPNGIKPIVEAMRMNPPLKSLILSDNWLYEEGGLEIAK